MHPMFCKFTSNTPCSMNFELGKIHAALNTSRLLDRKKQIETIKRAEYTFWSIQKWIPVNWICLLVYYNGKNDGNIVCLLDSNGFWQRCITLRFIWRRKQTQFPKWCVVQLMRYRTMDEVQNPSDSESIFIISQQNKTNVYRWTYGLYRGDLAKE
jgi:hypothetical protein